ncbi:sel1 repeat family protein [Alteromonas sp. C1M14]|uniref:sel1 repeat family protein n=1 Tax=Alteromonas sp. C1M14 TaxID=2841567 RepID=UPI001C0985A3|nr:sel1 repeat family protein [Alteromonas sp. C1M14]MBU2976993.1 sel1 repeat family protein [Alteromonas sp. C1M14]
MRGLFVALLALLLVGSDSGRYIPQLLRNAGSADDPAPLLWLAAQKGSQQAQDRLVAFASITQSEYWLNKLVSLDNADAAWALYKSTDAAMSDKKLMRLAAIGNVPEAQMQYAFTTDDPVEREKWLKRSAEQGYLPGQAALADWYLLNGAAEKALPWFRVTANDYPQSAFQYGRMLWDEGKKDAARKWISQAADAGLDIAQKVQHVLSSYTQYKATSVPAISRNNAQCHQKIGVFASSLATLVKADELVTNYEKDRRLQSLPMCIDRPVWLTPDSLKCDAENNGAGRLDCDVRPLATAVRKRGLTHAVVVGELGKANVNNGVMFLDLTDAYSVFVHELAHFAGFVDEYALGKEAAKRYCGAPEAPNLIFDGKISYAPLSTLQNWQTLQPGVGIWPAQTCARSEIRAYKPSGHITFLEHHDSGDIPPIYLALWRQQLADPKTQRPVFMNLFQAFQKAGQTTKAKEWLTRYEAFRDAQGVASSSYLFN